MTQQHRQHGGSHPGCPSRQTLADLALGRLPQGTIDTVGEHLERCSPCQNIVEALDDAEDSVISDLRLKSTATPGDIDAELEEQIRRAEEVGNGMWPFRAHGR